MYQEILDSGFIPNEICENLPSGFEDIEKLASELSVSLEKAKEIIEVAKKINS